MKILRPVLLIAVVLCISFIARANHVLGGNITWSCTGGNQYTITFTMYKDCFGASTALSTESVFIFPTGACNSIPLIADLTLQSTTEISDLCAAELANSSCNGGLIPGTQKLVYTGTITLDNTCNWKIIWNSGDWNYFNNINFGALPDAYITSTINASLGCYNSGSITSMDIPYECRNQGNVTNPINLNLPAGVTAAYAIVTPQTTGATNDTSIDAPGYANTLGATVNAGTGALTINTTGQSVGNYIITVQITLTQGGQTIGILNENVAIVIRDCTSTPTTFDIPEIQTLDAPAILVNSTTIDACAGDSICFTVSASNPNIFRGITLTSSWDASLNAGNPVFTQIPLTLNPAQGLFCMATNTATVGLGQNVHFEAADDACVLPGSDDIDITINIYPSVTLSVTDTMICQGSSLAIQATGGAVGSTFSWTVLSGDTTPGLIGNSGTQNLTTISQDTEIEVLLNGVPAQCNARDTLSVEIALQQLSVAITDESCLQNDGAVDLSVIGGSGNYTYLWTSGGYVTEDLTGIDSGNYSVTVTDTGVPGCTATITANVLTTAPPGGTIAAQGGTTICEGSSATLVFDGTGAAGQPYVLTVTGAGATVPPTIADLGTLNVTPPVGTTTYTLTSVSYQNYPGCVTNTNSQVAITVRPIINGVLSPAGPICSGSSLPLTIDLSTSQGTNVVGSYDVTFTANPVDPPGAPNASANPWTDGQVVTLNPTANTTYSITNVQYTSAPTCANAQNNLINVTVHPLPTATLTGATTVCAGVCANLTLTLTGTAPWVVSYTVNGGVVQTMNVASSPFLWNLCPVATSTYCITSVTDAFNCIAPIAGQCQIVTVNPLPAVTFTGNATICAGSSANLNFAFTSPAGLYDITLGLTDTDPLTGPTLVIDNFNSANGTTYAVSPTTNTTYTLTSIQYDGATGCSVSPNTVVTVNVDAAPIALNVTTTCNNISTAYTVSFTIVGSPAYSVLPAGGTLTGSSYTSAPINSGLAAAFTIDDAGVCPPLALNILATTCPVLTSAGTMSSNSITICGNGSATGIWNNNGFLDGNDQQMFILHTTANNTLGTVIATDCNDAVFGDADTPLTFGGGPGQIQYGTTYYISSVAGDDNGSGDCVNTAAANVQISPGQPVVWYQTPTAAISGGGSICSGQSTNVNIAFTGASPWQFIYSIGGVNQTAITTSTNPYVLSVSTAGAFALVSVNSTTSGCVGTVSGSANVTVNPLPTATITGPASVCAGSCVNLTITLTGTAPWTVNYTIAGVAQPALVVNASPYLLNVCPALNSTYCITSVTDANTCTNTYPNNCYSITVTPLPTAAFTVAAAEVCSGSSYNFVIDFTGTSQWTYVVSTPGGNVNGGPSNDLVNFSASAAGNYSIISVTDNTGCINTVASAVSTLSVNPLPTAAIAGPGSICTGQAYNFGVTFTGESPFTFNVDGPGANDQLGLTSATTNGSFSATVAGNYTISSVTDNNGCVSSAASAAALLTVNPLPTGVLSASATVCSGTNHDFTITLTGTGPFNINITQNGIPFTTLSNQAGPTATFSVGAAGTYNVSQVVDANCTNTAVSAPATLTVNPLPTATFTGGNAAFCSGSSVQLPITLTGAAPWSLIYSIGGVAQPAIAVAASPYNLVANAAGNFCLTQVTDANGCITNPVAQCVTVTQVTVPTANAGADLSGCSLVPIQIGTAAVAGVNYSWDNAALLGGNNLIAQPTATITNAGPLSSATTFTVTASVTQSGITCSATDAMILTIYPLPVVSILAADDSICFGATTTLTASGAGVGGQYTWLGDLATIQGATNAAGVTVAPIGTITYEVQGTDSQGCISTVTQDVIAADDLLIEEDYTANQCFGVCEGTIDLNPTGGFSPYTIVWAVPVTNPGTFNQDALCAGTYAYTVTDEQGCNTVTDNLQIVINALPQNFVDDVIVTMPVCSYDETGLIQIVEPGALDYQIYSTPGLGYIGPQASDTFTGQAAGGPYDIYVTDADGCSIDSLNIFIGSQSAPLSIAVDQFNQIFCYQEEVNFTGTGQGGFGNLVLNWYSCADTTGCLEGTGTPFPFVITQDTTLYAVITDANNCRSDTMSVSADLSDPIQLVVQNGIDLLEICEGECVDLSAATQGGNNLLTVQWFELPNTVNGPTVGPDGLSQTICPLLSTGYYAYASDGCNTPALDTVMVTVFDTPDIVFTADTLEGCYPLTVNFSNLTDPTDLGQCVWEFGNGVSLPVCGDISYTYSVYGAFTPVLNVTSNDGCFASDTLGSAINIYGYPEIDFTWEPQPVDVLNTEVDFINLTEGGVSYHWDIATFAESEEVNPSYDFPDIDLAVFPICLSSTTENGCTDTLCRDIVIQSIFQIWVPNSFTPDRDDVNEVFLPVLKGYNPNKYHLYIYDRWGAMVFETIDATKAWTGNVQDGAFYSQAEVFVWRIEAERLSDSKYEVYEGTVTLIR